MVRVAVEVRHRVEHAGLDCLSTLLEEPHHRAPRDGGEDGELTGIGRQGAAGHRRRGLGVRLGVA